jgi:hypothetical protein
MWFRRRKEETYNEQLLREAGLAAPEPQPEPGFTPAQDPIAAITGTPPRTSEWDAIVTVDAPGIRGDEVTFVTLPEGDILVESEVGDDDLSPLADAVEREVQRPYRASARRNEGSLWAVGVRRLDVRRLTLEQGDELELVVRDGERTLTVDGEPSDAAVPELAEHGDYVIRGSRLDGDLWEIGLDRL